MMHEREKSDPAIVAVKPTNKAERSAAEPVERRAGANGNADQHNTCRAQYRVSVSQALERIRQVRRHSLGVGAVCGKAARTVLCGGRSAMGVPTAIVATLLAMTLGRPRSPDGAKRNPGAELGQAQSRIALRSIRATAPSLPPAAMQPEPLIRIFANPALDHRGDRLHRSLNIDLAGGVADRLHFFGQ